jgi:hypothetical protein
MQPARSIEDGPHRGGIVLQLLPKRIDLGFLDDADPARTAHGAFELGLTAEGSEGVAQRFHVQSTANSSLLSATISSTRSQNLK